MKPSSQTTTDLKRLTQVERFTLFATIIGLIVDLIALIGFVGLVVTPPKPSGASLGSDEFFVWMLIALVYSLGLINSLIYGRWRRRNPPDTFDYGIFRRLALAALTSFPVTYVYLRALESGGVLSTRPNSTWGPFLGALLFLFFCRPCYCRRWLWV